MTATTRYLVALSLLALALPIQSWPDSLDHGIAWDTREVEGFHQMMVVGPEYLNPARLKSLYREHAQDTDRVFRIDAVESRSDAEHMNGRAQQIRNFRTGSECIGQSGTATPSE